MWFKFWDQVKSEQKLGRDNDSRLGYSKQPPQELNTIHDEEDFELNDKVYKKRFN